METRRLMTAVILALPMLAIGCGDEDMVGGAAPVATADSAITDAGTPVVLHPTANDTADGLCLAAQTIDLDPATSGQQMSWVTAAGTFAVQPGGEVLFTPAPGFAGIASAAYVVADVAGHISNPANLIVTVKAADVPPPSGLTARLVRERDPVGLPRLVPADAFTTGE
jgi:hypothetical protein